MDNNDILQEIEVVEEIIDNLLIHVKVIKAEIR